jgi:hypothetical protein
MLFVVVVGGLTLITMSALVVFIVASIFMHDRPFVNFFIVSRVRNRMNRAVAQRPTWDRIGRTRCWVIMGSMEGLARVEGRLSVLDKRGRYRGAVM